MKSFLVIGALALAYLFSGCAGIKKDDGFYSAKHPKYSIEIDREGRKNGKEIWWHPNGNKKYEATNHNGVREGLFSAWYADGMKWYEGFEYQGKPESTLTYWFPNGKIKSQALFRAGIQLERKDFDEDGHLIVPRETAENEILPSPDDGDEAGEGMRLRNAGLQIWSLRVRQAVESYWSLPKAYQKERPYRTVAKIKVGSDGKILKVTWLEKSPSEGFNVLAQQTFKRIKRLPAFPPQVKDPTLDIQYEFISLGKQVPRRKLELRDPGSQSAPEE